MWYGVATLVGTIIGAGIFGLPYAASRAGFFVQLAYLGVFCCVFALLHLMHGEIMLRTHDRYRLPGYVGKYLGKSAKQIMQGVAIVGLVGGMLAYVLLGGSFLHMLSGGAFGSVASHQVLFWAVMSAMIALGLTMVKRAEGVMLAFMVAIIAILFVFSIPHISLENLAGSGNNFFFPYGISMFALSGIAAIPAVRDLLYGKESRMKWTIIAGTLIPAALYALFVFSILGVAGPLTSDDAFSGLRGMLDVPAELLGAAFGIFAVATSYIVFGLYLRDMLWYDFSVPKRIATVCAVAAPILFLLMHPESYISVIGFIGAVCGGAEAIFIIATFMRARTQGKRVPEYVVAMPAFVLYVLIIFFALGIGYTIYSGI